MEKEEFQVNEPNLHHNRAEPVACVAGVAGTPPPTWPPAWLAALNPPPKPHERSIWPLYGSAAGVSLTASSCAAAAAPSLPRQCL